MVLEKPVMQLGGFNFLQGFVQVEVSIICCCGATSGRGAGGRDSGVALLGQVYLFIPICSLRPK